MRKKTMAYEGYAQAGQKMPYFYVYFHHVGVAPYG